MFFVLFMKMFVVRYIFKFEQYFKKFYFVMVVKYDYMVYYMQCLKKMFLVKMVIKVKILLIY